MWGHSHDESEIVVEESSVIIVPINWALIIEKMIENLNKDYQSV